MNSNFRVKVGRQLVGWSGFVRFCGEKLATHILQKALRSRSDVFRYKATKLGVYVTFYAK